MFFIFTNITNISEQSISFHQTLMKEFDSVSYLYILLHLWQ